MPTEISSQFYQAYLLIFFLAFYLVHLRRFCVVERLLLGSAGEYCDLELAVEVRRRKEEEEGAETETEACQLT